MSKKTNTSNKKDWVSRELYIEQLSLSSNKIHMTNKNKKTGIACLNFAFPLCTCREDAPCKNTCYANKGTQTITVVQAAYYRNFRLMNENIDDVFEQIEFEIKHSGLNMVRFFDSGDIPNYDFLYRMCKMMEKFPDVSFMAFTKKYELVNEYIANGNIVPDNFNIIFSAWDHTWKFDNPYDLPIAYVDFKDKRLNPEIPDKAFRCPSIGKKLGTITCSMCKKCWNKNTKTIVFAEH